MVKLYLASSYGRREELRFFASQLVEVGFAITSRWLSGDHDAPDSADGNKPAWDRFCADQDVEDIDECDILVVFTGAQTKGGYHTEVGLALGLGKGVVIVGPRENVFHHLQGILQFDRFDDFLYNAALENNVSMEKN